MFRSAGDVIAYLRKREGIDDVELAHEANMTVGPLREIESGVPPDEDQLEALAEVLGVSPEGIRFAAGDMSDQIQQAILNHPDEALNSIKDNLPMEQYKQSEPSTDPDDLDEPIYETDQGQLFKGNSKTIIPKLPQQFDCIFADPPFNLDKSYGEDVPDDLPEEEYLQWTKEWIDPCIEALKDGGSFFIFNLPKWNIPTAHYVSKRLRLKDWIAIDLRFSLPIPKRLYPSHYSLLYFVKGEEANHFSPPRLPVETCKHCGGEQRDYGGYKNKMNPKGVNLSDVWDDIPPVRHSKYMKRDANQLSIKMLHRVLDIATEEGGAVLDPFGGAGTTYAAAEIMNREWVGIEIANCEPIVERLENPSHDRELINQYEMNQNVLFTKDALEKRAEYRDLFGFNFEDYNLEDSPTDSINRKLPFSSD